MGEEYGSVAVGFEKILEGRVSFLAALVERRFYRGTSDSTGLLRGVLLVSLWWLVYPRWFLETTLLEVENFPRF